MYRIHENQGSATRLHAMVGILEKTLQRLSALLPNFEHEYSKEIESFVARTNYVKALVAWKRGELQNARSTLRSLFHKRKSAICVYPFAFMDFRVFNYCLGLFYSARYRLKHLYKFIAGAT